MTTQCADDRRIGLVISPAARATRRLMRQGSHFWRGLLPESQVRLAATPAALDAAVAAFDEAGIGTIAGLGGDGSLRRLIDAILRHHGNGHAPQVLALAGGTMNGVARSFGTGGSPARCLRRVLAAQTSVGAARRVQPMLRITDPGRTGVRHAFSLATGAACRAYDVYYRHPTPGLRAAVSATLEPVRSVMFGGDFFHGVTLDVEADGEHWMSQAHTLVASVLEQPVLWFRPFGSPPDNRSTFNLVATSLPPRQMALRLWSLCRGRYRHRDVRIDQLPHANITVHGDVSYLLDGDLQPRGDEQPLRLSLSIGPSITFLTAANGRADPVVAAPAPGQ